MLFFIRNAGTWRQVRIRILPLIAIAHLLFIGSVYAQSVDLNNLPSGTESFEGFDERYVSYRPAFALNGFDCDANGATCAHGLGLKQIVQNLVADGTQSVLVKALFDLSAEELEDPDGRRIVARNTQRAQALGFVALVTLVLEQNGYSASDLGISSGVSHAEAMGSLTRIVTNLPLIQIDDGLSDDGVKWVGTLGNLTRFVDQYLALEQAYTHYGLVSEPAFSCEVKSDLLQHLEEQFRLVDDLGNRAIVDLDFLKPIGLPSNILGADYDEVQAGNWSMKLHATVGYAALAQQIPLEGSCSTFTPEEEDKYTDRVHRAFRSTGPNDDPERKHHWAFQTGGGERFWAEGDFYFNYGLASVIPFWQTVRAQQIEGFDWEDPFVSDWFLEPLRGYAERVDPNGFVPPLEDGNKIPMEAAFMMRWNEAFSSDPALGKQFAWIAAAQSELPGEDNWLNILFLPTATSYQGPVPTLAPGTVDEDPHQIILRRDGGTNSCNQLPEERTAPCHYVLLNGEPRAGIRPGEGHEQSDQLQLLYYVDGQSFIMDAGYDNAPGIKNSTWNDYHNHNVMTVFYDRLGVGHGGLPGPKLGVNCPILAPCELGMFANHAAVDEWVHTQSGRVDMIQGRVTVETDANDDLAPTSVNYQRTLLFVDDPLKPYLIDINAAEWLASNSNPGELPRYVMQYHVNSDDEDLIDESRVPTILGVPKEFGTYPKRTNHSLYLKRFAVEGPANQFVTVETLRESTLSNYERGEGLPAWRFGHSNQTDEQLYLPDFTTVAFIQPQFSNLDQYACVPADARELANRRDDASVYAWQVDMNTVDVLMVRSAGFPLSLPLAMNTNLSALVESNGWEIDNEFTSGGVSLENNFEQMAIEGGQRAGFVRLRRVDKMDGCVSVSTETEAPSSFKIGANFPNPVRHSTDIAIELSAPQHVKIAVFDMLGRRVQELVDAWMSSGKHLVKWQATDVPAGNYILRFQIGEQVRSRQVTVLR